MLCKPAPEADLQGIEGEIVVGRLDIDADALDEAWECLSDVETRRARRLRTERDRRRYVAARAQLRRLLAERLGTRPDAVELATAPRGKPRLDGRFADSRLRFNVSHSEDLVVYAFARGREVGVDVEAVTPWRGANAIAARFFSRREHADYTSLPEAQRTDGFFNCWTRKEAFCKALGEALHLPLRRFDVSLKPDEPARILRVDTTPGEACGWRLHAFKPAPGFTAALVVGLDA